MASSNGVENEDYIVTTFFHLLQTFSYDKAKELVDKQKELCKSAHGTPAIWSPMLAALSNLAVAEKSYSSFMYLSPKWFGRKDAKNLYISVAQSCKKIGGDESFQKAGMLSSLAHVCGQLAQYATAKSDMIDFFGNLHAVTGVKFCDRSDLLDKITHILKENTDKFHHPYLIQLKDMFEKECEILKQLLQAEVAMSKWNFMDSLLCLQEAHKRITQIQAHHSAAPKDNWKLSFMGIKSSSSPVLYAWLKQYKDVIYSKFTLYFYDVLSKHAPGGELKPYLTKSSSINDFYSKIVAFQKRTDAYVIALILEAGGLDFQGPVYFNFSQSPRVLTGTQSYRAIFCYPPDCVEEGQLPNHYLASLVMIMMGKEQQLNQSDKPVDEFDQKSNSSYFISRIDPRVALVIIYRNKKTEREKKAVMSFLQEISSQLRYTKLFADLRPS